MFEDPYPFQSLSKPQVRVAGRLSGLQRCQLHRWKSRPAYDAETIQFGKSSASHKRLLHSNAIFPRLGQTCTIDHVGNMGKAYGPVDPSSRSFSLTNNWNQPVNIGASCALITPSRFLRLPQSIQRFQDNQANAYQSGQLLI